MEADAHFLDLAGEGAVTTWTHAHFVRWHVVQVFDLSLPKGHLSN